MTTTTTPMMSTTTTWTDGQVWKTEFETATADRYVKSADVDVVTV